jgi:hypothetical protein
MIRPIALAASLLLLTGCSPNVTWRKEPPLSQKAGRDSDVQLLSLDTKEGLQVLPDGIAANERFELVATPPNQIIGVMDISGRALRYGSGDAIEESIRDEAARHGGNLVAYSAPGHVAWVIHLAPAPPVAPKTIDEREAELTAAHPDYARTQSWDLALPAIPKMVFTSQVNRCYAVAITAAPETSWSPETRKRLGLELARKERDPILDRTSWIAQDLSRTSRTFFQETHCASKSQEISIAFRWSTEDGTQKVGAGPARLLLYERAPQPGEIAALEKKALDDGEDYRRRMCSGCWRMAAKSCAVPRAICNPYLLCLRDSMLTADYCK